MNRSQKLAVAVSALTVAGLAVIAAPAIASAASTVGGWALFAPASAAPTAAPDAPVAAAQSSEAAPDTTTGPPEGYVDVGHGTSIPAGGPGDCESSAYIWIGSEDGGPSRAEMGGSDLVDMGPREFAAGEVGLDGQGRPATYIVEPGDATGAIGERFCIYNALTLEVLNGYSHGRTIQPGDTLILNADLITDWVDPYADE